MGLWGARRGRLGTDAGRGLIRRFVLASALLAILVGGVFTALLLAINGLRTSADLARHSEDVLATANRLERLAVDLETGVRGYIITGDETFLAPWSNARAQFAGTAARLERLASLHSSSQGARADAITRNGIAYVREYSVPTVELARRDPAAAREPEVLHEGKRRFDTLRDQFARFDQAEREISSLRAESSAADARTAVAVAATGIGVSLLLIVAFTAYNAQTIIRPVRRASAMAGEIAAGDLTVRMPETAPAEIGDLEHSFNVMARSMEADRGELRRMADDQAALRRVATLVARGVPPAAVFEAVAAEMGRMLNADYTAVERYEPDGNVTVVGSWNGRGDPELSLPVGSQWATGEDSVAGMVRRTGRSTRVMTYADMAGDLAEWARSREITAGTGSPVTVEGRLWGTVIVFSTASRPQPEGVESRMLDFTELVATAIANAESRAELAASRARVVEAGDATRRRIERDLHDGAQQRLVSLGLELRAAEAGLAPDQAEVKEQLAATARGMAAVVKDLQEISRGLHPAILSKGGLGPALRALARRSALPVELSVGIGRGQLPERVEVAVYYIVTEALTNATKHANASVVRISVVPEDATVRLSVHDDGIGGADPRRGSGLIGLRDRVEALGGRIRVESPAGQGTTLLVTIPVDARPA